MWRHKLIGLEAGTFRARFKGLNVCSDSTLSRILVNVPNAGGFKQVGAFSTSSSLRRLSSVLISNNDVKSLNLRSVSNGLNSDLNSDLNLRSVSNNSKSHGFLANLSNVSGSSQINRRNLSTSRPEMNIKGLATVGLLKKNLERKLWHHFISCRNFVSNSRMGDKFQESSSLLRDPKFHQMEQYANTNRADATIQANYLRVQKEFH